MIPTASSSSTPLLTPAAPGGAGIAAADAQAAPDAGLGGFGLLLGAMQQLQQVLPAAPAGDGTASAAAAGDGEQGGNGLPLAGMLLPSVLPVSAKPAGAGELAETGMSGEKSADKNETDDAGADFLLFSALQSTAVTTTAAAGTGNAQGNAQPAQTAIGDIAALTTGDEVAAQIAAATTAPASRENGGQKADRNTLVSLNPGLAESARAAADPALAGKIDTGVLAKVIPDATAVEADFDSLVKHFEAPASSPVTPATAGVGESSPISHASRTYASAMNSHAAVNVPVGGDGWGDAVADKVMWFSANKVSSAEIHLNPPDLGPLQVRVSTQQDQASVVFTSQHAAVRDALDQALPRLRDMMGNQGMQLLDVSVGGHTPQQQQQQFGQNNPAPGGLPFGGIAGDDAAEAKTVNVTHIDTARLRSGFDAYA